MLPTLKVLDVFMPIIRNLKYLRIMRMHWPDVNQSKFKSFWWTNKLLFIFFSFREVFGPNGRLLEVANPGDQRLALKVMKAAEDSFKVFQKSCHWCNWWSGLKNNGHSWMWIKSKCYPSRFFYNWIDAE